MTPKRQKCRHVLFTDHHSERLGQRPIAWLTCDDCGSWLSLGPSRDTWQTTIEVMAARWAVEYSRPSKADECPFGDHYGVCQARYLADVIRDHEEPVEPIADLIAKSSIGAGLRNIAENGIEAEISDLEADLADMEDR